MIRQILASLVIMIAALLAWVFFVPGARDTLEAYGIPVPFGAPAEPATTAQRGPTQGGAPGAAQGGRPGGMANRQTNVVTSAVVLSTINDSLNAIGEGTASRSVTVSSPVGGDLAEIVVRPGQIVNVGDVIGRLDSDAEQIAYDRAQLAADDANATLTRTRGLANSNVVATTALTAAQLSVSNAALEVRNAEFALNRRTIKSPITGTVGLMRVIPGNYVTAQTPVTTVDDTSSILVDFWVPERFAAAVKLGAPVSVGAVALPGSSFAGEVSAIDNRIDPASRTLQVQAEIPNAEGQLRPGMSFTVALKFPGETFPTVNPLSILWSADGSYVWKYVDGKAQRVMAEIVQRNSDGVLVRAELAPGDAIITEGLLQLNEGATVTLLSGPDGTDAAPQTAAAATQS